MTEPANCSADGAAVSTLSGPPLSVVWFGEPRGLVAAGPRERADQCGHHERRQTHPHRGAGERARAGVGVAGLGGHRRHDAGLEFPLDDLRIHLVAICRGDGAGERHRQRHIGVRIGQRRQVRPALQNHRVAGPPQRDIHPGGIVVHVRQLWEFGERQVGEVRLRPDIPVVGVVGDRDLFTERQTATVELRPLVVAVARLGRGGDLPRHPVVGGDRHRRPDAHAAGGQRDEYQQHEKQNRVTSPKPEHGAILEGQRAAQYRECAWIPGEVVAADDVGETQPPVQPPCAVVLVPDLRR